MSIEAAGSDRASFGRRSFLKGTAATLGLAATTGLGCAPKPNLETTEESQEAAPAEETFYASCRANCQGGCRVKIKVRDGKVVSTSMAELPDERYNRICARGLSHLQFIYNENRLRYPMRRTGERGEDKWEQITWDEAISEISSKWSSYREEYGNSSIAFFTGGGNYGASVSVTDGNNMVGHLKNTIGGTTITHYFDWGYFFGSMISVGLDECSSGNELVTLPESKTIIIWGGNPSVAQPQSWHFIMEAKKAGAKLICIDPTVTKSACASDIHVSIRPGTDAALAMAMINVVVENGWVNTDFIKKSTVGPLLVKKSDGMYLRQSDLGLPQTKTTDPATGEEKENDEYIVLASDGSYDTPDKIDDPVIEGTHTINDIEVTCAYTLMLESCAEWTPSRVATLCDIDESMIREITEIYAKNGPSTIWEGFGPDHYANGHYAYFAMAALAAVTGNLGKHGAFAGCCLMDGPYIISSAFNAVTDVEPGPNIPGPIVNEIAKSKTICGMPIDLKSLYVYAGNPLASMVDRKQWIEFLNSLELVVVADIMMSDTARYADIVLPVVHWFEMEDVSCGCTPFIGIQEKAIEPSFEAKSDYEIAQLIGRKMGLKGNFEMPLSEFHEKLFDNGNARNRGVTWEAIKEGELFRTITANPHIHGENNIYPTSTGRVEFYRESPASNVDYGQTFDIEKERLPHWEPPYEAWSIDVDNYPAHELAKSYPLILNTERNKMRTHTIFGHNPWLLELYNEPVCHMNPVDAEQRGIANADYVKVFNDRGEVTVKVITDPRIRPGVIQLSKGWEVDQFKSGHYGDLTHAVVNPACVNNCYFDALVEVEKA